jgi:putative ABC transport system permease protein
VNGPRPPFERPRRSPRQIQEDVDEELRLHMELRAAGLQGAGMVESAARDEAARRMGDLAETRRECAASDHRWERAMRRRAMVEDVLQDLAHGFRQLRARPRFAVPTVLTLAVGIGAATAIVGAADHVLFRPLPYREPEQVVTLWERDRTSGERRQVSPGNLLDWKARTRSFAAMGLAEPNGADLTEVTPPVPLRSWDVSEGFLEALGVAPTLGRLFQPEEYSGDQRVVLISHEFWRGHLAADPGAVGRTIGLDDHAYRIVGVLPAGIEYPEKKSLWMPKHFRPHEPNDRSSSYMDAAARLKPGVTLSEARVDLERVSRQLGEEHPRSNASIEVEAVPIGDHLLGRVRVALLILVGAVLLMLLIVCANVAGLLLARGVERERELAIRLALGADRFRIARQLLTEAMLLAGLGGILGVGLAWAGTRALAAGSPDWLPRAASLGVDGRVLAMAVAITAVSALLFGLIPALRFSKTRAERLVVGVRETTGRRGVRLRRVLVVGEIAAALVLSTGAGLLMRSFADVLSNDLGYEARGRASVQIFIWDRNPTPAARLQRVEEITEAFREIPGVEEVGVVTALPAHPSQIDAQDEMVIEGRPPGPGGDPRVFTTIASPDYFRAMAIPLLAGRSFERHDNPAAPRVVLVNQALARRYFPDENPVGKRVRVGAMSAPEPREIVGVVGDVRPSGYESDPRPELYIPYEQTANGSVTIVARTSAGVDGALATMRARLAAIDPRQPIYHSAPVEELVERTMVERRFYLRLMTVFSIVALGLAAIGVYGLMSMTTTSRSHEIGVRLALGARPADIVRMVMAEGARMIALGLGLGALGAMWFAVALRSMHLKVGDLDPATFAQVATLLFVVAGVAVLIPALRSARVDPMVVLRSE